MTKADVIAHLAAIIERSQGMRDAVCQGTAGKTAFLKNLDQTELDCHYLRAAVIEESRLTKKGLKADGTPDKRFKANRPKDKLDLRYKYF